MRRSLPSTRSARCGLLALAVVASPLAVLAAGPEATPAQLWRERIAEVREWKLWIATLGAALLALGVALRLAGQGDRLTRVRGALLLLLAVATVVAWWHPYRGSLRAWLHVGDAYHYFMGAKYFDELGYTRLYHCSVVADAEAGLRPQLVQSQIRNLETNALESARLALRDPGHCQRHFSPERWQAFSDDLRFFRQKLPVPLWFRLRSDHGYNPPPTWTLVGRWLTSEPASRDTMFRLTAIDPVLIALMVGCIAWGFGWRVACIAWIFWGTNQPASWEWVGGSILRFDWLAASLAGLCCLRRGHPVAAGVLLAWAVGIRVFPAAIVGGVGLAAALRMLRERSWRPTAAQRRFALSFTASLAALVALSSLAVGVDAWQGFVENSRTHLTTDSMNRTGLRPLLAYRHEARIAVTQQEGAADPFVRWREERRATADARQPLRWALTAGYVALLVLALRRRPDWAAGALGIGAVTVFLEVGNYYLGVLTGFALLAKRHEEIGAGLLLVSAVSWWLGTWGGPDRDTLTAATSLAIFVFVFLATARMIASDLHDDDATA